MLIRRVIVKRQPAITAVSNAATHQKASRSAVAGMRIALKSGAHRYDALATRGAIGFGAGLLLAGKFKRGKRKVLGWKLFLSGLASTIPIGMRVFGKKEASATEH